MLPRRAVSEEPTPNQTAVAVAPQIASADLAQVQLTPTPSATPITSIAQPPRNTPPPPATRKKRHSPWLSTVIVLVVALVVLVGVNVFHTHATSPLVPSAVPQAIIPAQTVAATPTPGFVQQAAPTHIAIPALGVSAAVKLYTLADAKKGVDAYTGTPCYHNGQIMCIDPPTFMDTYWMQSGIGGIKYGAMPGSDAQSNVYIIGHASERIQAIFTQMYKMAVGDRVTVTNEYGTLIYTVDQVVTVPKGDYSTLPLVTQQKPGKLLLVTCNYAPDATFAHNSSSANVVVSAHLTSATNGAG